jgi:hypothetical protein
VPTLRTGWVAAKPGAVLSFADGTLMMMDECYEETGGMKRAMAGGRLVLTRNQVQEEWIGRRKKIKPPVPKIDHLIFLTEDDAEARELFLTEHEIEHPMVGLYKLNPVVPAA